MCEKKGKKRSKRIHWSSGCWMKERQSFQWHFTTYASPDEASAANDSRLLRPNNVCGTRDIVTTECRRPDDVDAYNIKCEWVIHLKWVCVCVPHLHHLAVDDANFTCDNFARNAISLVVGAFSPPSDNRRTWLAIMPLVH